MPSLDSIYKPKTSSLISEQVGADLVSHPMKLIRSNSPKDRNTLDKGCSESSRKTLLEVALYYAESGIYVFPCKVGLKTPACKNGHLDATRDPEQIKKWWVNFPYNIGINTELSGLVVVDKDVVAGRSVGWENFQKLLGYEPLNTLAVTTRSGGKQYYFKAPTIPIKCSISKLCDKVDIKAIGGYVIAPPSYVEADEKSGAGYYFFDETIEPSKLPLWLENHLIALQQPNPPKKHEGHATDIFLKSDNYFPCNETNREKLRIAFRQRRETHDCSSQDAWVQLLFEFRSLVYLVGWSDQQAWALFDEICRSDNMGNYHETNNRIRWDVDDFRPDGRTYKSLLDELSKHDAEPDVLVEFPNKDQTTTKSKIFQMLTVRDLLRLKVMSWLVKGLLPSEGIGALFGPSGSGKSFLIIDLLMHLCLGRDWFGYKIHKKHTVLYLALEGGAGVRNRVEAYLKHNAINETDNFFTIIDSFDIRQQFGDLIETVKEIKPSIIVIDTLNQSAAGCDENSNVDMSLIVSRAKIIADAIKGLVLLVHHTGKDASKGLRGHSSLNAALDVAIEVQAETVKTPRFFKITKSKDGACGDGLAFKLKSIDLGVDADGDAITSCVVERDISELFRMQIPVGKNAITAWDLLKNQLPISYSEAKTKVKDALIEESPSRKRPDNTAKDAIDGLHQQGFVSIKDDTLSKG